MQASVLAGQELGMAVETLLLTIQSGTVTIVLVVVEADIDEVPPDEIDYNAPTPVSHPRPHYGRYLKQCYSSCSS